MNRHPLFEVYDDTIKVDDETPDGAQNVCNQSDVHTAVRYTDHTAVRTKDGDVKVKTISKEAIP